MKLSPRIVTRWFSVPHSEPLSIGANTILRTLYGHNGQKMETGLLMQAAGFEPQEQSDFETLMSELRRHTFVSSYNGVISLTGRGRRRCQNPGGRLGAQLMRQRPGNWG